MAFLGLGVYIAHGSDNSQSVGNVIAIFGLAPRLISPISGLSGSMLLTLQSWPSIETILRMKDSVETSRSPAAQTKLSQAAPTIEARNLFFSYPGNSARVFDGLTFQVPAGRRTGLVARLGQGKTTFFKLLLKFYNPSGGQLLLDDKPIEEYAASTLREKIAMMSQFPAFFHDSLRENFLMANPEADDDKIETVCRLAGVWDILLRQNPPITLDTDIGAAQFLSGGQKRLLALARCLLRDPDLLLLDEPAANVDNEEKFGALLTNIRQATAGKTVVVVDHDVNWLLQLCDWFVVLDQGKVVEEGTMEELLGRKGLLYSLYIATQGPRAEDIARCIVRQ
jgi:ATP-binding cassette, subfamily B, bacterial